MIRTLIMIAVAMFFTINGNAYDFYFHYVKAYNNEKFMNADEDKDNIMLLRWYGNSTLEAYKYDPKKSILKQAG